MEIRDLKNLNTEEFVELLEGAVQNNFRDFTTQELFDLLATAQVHKGKLLSIVNEFFGDTVKE